MLEQYLHTHTPALIQLGSGGNILANWYNTDARVEAWWHPDTAELDATQPFAIPDSTFDRVYSEHMIEHLDYWSGQNMLQESYRILKPNGRIRITCPDIEFLIRLYQTPNELESSYIKDQTPEEYPYPDRIFVFNNYVRAWGHKFIYNRETLERSLLAAGFTNITEHRIAESQDPLFQNLEVPTRMKPGYLQLESFTLEAEKIPN